MCIIKIMIFGSTKPQFITGNEAVIEAAKRIGANCMCGYPITPTTEIMEGWAKLHDEKPDDYKFIQAEDETSAGFNVIGAILGGAKAFTTTAGPGHILMQDPIIMAEAMRIPFVGVIMQRGGPSTGTVVYGQQETTLACFGGNGEGLRNVYSAGNPQELYDYTIKAFNAAWYTKFPSFVLGDGYSAKMKQNIVFNPPSANIKAKILVGGDNQVNLRNCYNFEDELHIELSKNIDDWKKFSGQVKESHTHQCADAETIFVAHGIVAEAAREAVDHLRKNNKKVGLFKPITLRPFDHQKLSGLAARANRVIIIESSFGHLERIVKSRLYGLTKIDTYQKPVMPISVEEIISLV